MNGVEVREEKACRCSASNLSALNGKDAVVPASKQVSCAHPGSTTASHIESWFTETLCKERSAISAMFESRHQALEQDLRTWLRTRMPSGCSAHAAATSQALWPMSPTKPLEEDEDVYPPLPDAEQEVMQVANAHINAEQVVTKKISVRRSSYIDVPLLDGERDSRASIRASRASSLQMMVKAKTTASRAGISKADKLFTIINGPQHSLMKTSPHMPRSKRLLALLIEQFMGIITMLNIVSISISTDYGTEWTGWVIINAFFAICYTAEMAVKLHLLGCKLYFRGSEYAWNILEATLVFFALTELIITVTALFADDSAEEASSSKVSLLRVVRLARIVRVVRLCKLDAFGELAQIINGAMGGMRTLAWSMVLVCLPLYTVALILRETVGTYDDAADHAGVKEFTHLGPATFAVFRCVVAGDCTNEDGMPIIVLLQQRYGWGYAILYVCTLLGFNFGLVNVILAIYVENSVAASKYSQIIKKRNRLMNNKLVSEKAFEMVSMIVYYAAEVLETPECVEYMARGNILEDVNIADDEKVRELVTVAADLEITQELWKYLSKDARFSELLSELDISAEDQLDLFDTFDVNGSQTLDLVELLQGVKKLRGDPHRSDVIGVSLLVRGVMESLEIMHECVDSIYQQQEALVRIVKRLSPQSMYKTSAVCPGENSMICS